MLETSELTAPETFRQTVSLPRLRHSVAWSLFGNTTYALSQWVLLTALAKLGGAQMVGELALALAITSPVYLFTSLQLSTVQATDTFDSFRFGDYLTLRLASTGLAMILIVLTLTFWSQSPTTAAVTLLITISKAFDSVSDLIYGFFRKYERMDLISNSQIAKGLVSSISFIIALKISAHITWAAGALACAGGSTLIAYDIPTLKRLSVAASSCRLAPRWSKSLLLKLVKITLPLGISAMLVSLNVNMPRYFISHALGQECLGYFAGAAYFTMAGTFVVSAVAQAVMPRLALYHKLGDLPALKAVVVRLSALAVGVGVAGILISAIGGRQILSTIYRPDYAPYALLLLLLSVGATVGYEVSVMNCTMNAVHRFREQLPLCIATIATTSAGCWLLIPRYSLYGAAVALAAGYTLQLTGAAMIVRSGLRTRAVSAETNPWAYSPLR